MRAIVIALTAGFVGVVAVAPRTVVVTGLVTDATSRAPIPNVTVTASALGWRAQSFTDATGRYAVRVTVADSVRQISVDFRRPGYSMAAESRALPDATHDSLVVNASLAQVALGLASVVTSATIDPTSGIKTPFAVAKVTSSDVSTSGNVQLRGKVAGYGLSYAPGSDPAQQWNTEEYAKFDENPFLSVGGNPLSTFSVDVDRASYANVRRFIAGGRLPPKGAVRVEELLNYFRYDLAGPTGADPVAIHVELAPAPWNPSHRIARIGIQARRIDTDKLPPANLVFLIDVSGSMYDANKLPLVKSGFRLLVNELREQDRVAIVVYAGAAGLVLPSTPASDKVRILAAIDGLEAGGSTAGGAGIRLAYQIAKDNFRAGGNNRVILATDGDFNIGVSSTSELIDLVEAQRTSGVFLTVLGFGTGNLKDARMEQLADKGNGNYAYVDDIAEARKVFVHEFGATMFTVAKDVKLQVEFNPAAVQAYRLIGYENRALAKEDFTNDAKDAGDMGAGHTVTALYEIVPVGAPLDVATGSTPALKYQSPQSAVQAPPRELMTVSLRYKDPQGETSRLLQRPVMDEHATASTDMRFAQAVAAYGMLLRGSPHVGAFSYDAVLDLARGALGDDREKYRADFVKLVEDTRKVSVAVAGRDR